MSEIKQVLVDQKARLERKFEKERIIERGIPDLKKYLSQPNVLAILGVRRSGKSTLAETLLRGENFGYLTSSRLEGEGSPRSRGLRPFHGRYSVVIHDEGEGPLYC